MWYIYFDKDSCTELLIQAYHAINGLEDTILTWVNTDFIMNTKCFNKHTSFIFGHFDGDAFNYIKSLKISIFGPQCLLDYLRNDDILPRIDIPLFSNALKNVEICFTAFNEDIRKDLSEKVRMMNGTVSGDLNISTNILVAKSIGTKKCRAAGHEKIPIVSVDWINEIWELSGFCDPLNGLDESLINKFRLPLFHNLLICVSGFSVLEREEMEQLIVMNGGQYKPDLIVGQCTHLIAREARGPKFDCAKKWKILIVNWKWLTDSVRKDYACDEYKYQLSEMENTKQPQLSTSNTIEDQINETISFQEESNLENGIEENRRIWKNCVIQFLECETDFINKWDHLINDRGGRTCTNMIENLIEVTHVIVGDRTKLDEIEDDIIYIDPSWLQICFDENQLVDTEKFVINTKKSCLPPSPAVFNNIIVPLPSQNWDSINQYLSVVEKEEEKKKESSNRIPNLTIINLSGIFDKYKFYLDSSLSGDLSRKISAIITDNNGTIHTNPIDTDYYVVSDLLFQPKPQSNATKSVTLFYLTESIRIGKLLPLESDFMFSPVLIDQTTSKTVLNGTVLSFSGYPLEERALLKRISSEFGAVVQDQMSRKSIPSKNILATTHLIISKPDMKKLPSCKSWQIPAVTKYWIGECIIRGKLVDTTNYTLELSVDKTVSGSEKHEIIAFSTPKIISNNNHLKLPYDLMESRMKKPSDKKLGCNVSELIKSKPEESLNSLSVNSVLQLKSEIKDVHEIDHSINNETITENGRKRKATEDFNDLIYPSKQKMCLEISSKENIQFTESDSVKIFMFCSLDEELYKGYTESIKKLGGLIESGTHFNMKITHLISGEPGRTEKYLSALASGKWVLHKSFIDQSILAGKWLDENEFQWGGPKTNDFLLLNHKKSNKKYITELANAAKRLREVGGGVFKDWRVCLLEDDNKLENISNIIKSGGGTVLPLTEPLSQLDVSHVLINETHCCNIPDLSFYPCYKIDLIPNFLITFNKSEKEKILKKFTISSNKMKSLIKRKVK